MTEMRYTLRNLMTGKRRGLFARYVDAFNARQRGEMVVELFSAAGRTQVSYIEEYGLHQKLSRPITVY